MPFDCPTFSEWFAENKEGDIMKDGYRTYQDDMRSSGIKPMTYRQWAKDQFEGMSI